MWSHAHTQRVESPKNIHHSRIKTCLIHFNEWPIEVKMKQCKEIKTCPNSIISLITCSYVKCTRLTWSCDNCFAVSAVDQTRYLILTLTLNRMLTYNLHVVATRIVHFWQNKARAIVGFPWTCTCMLFHFAVAVCNLRRFNTCVN